MPYIYKITNSVNGKCYIGKTSRTLNRRFAEHKANMKNGADRPLYRAMRKYGVENFLIESLDFVSTDTEAIQREKYYIEKFNTLADGYNATSGGDGRAYLPQEKIYELHQSKLTCVKIASVLACSAEQVSNILRDMGITTESLKVAASNDRKKPVAKIDIRTGEILDTYPSLKDAGRAMGSEQKKQHIGAVCNNKRKMAYGFHWKFL